MNEVFFDVDTQIDFMFPTGNLYVPGAEKIIPTLAKLTEYARQQGIPVLASVDAHTLDDPEFRTWPPHCVVGIWGQRKIRETRFESPVIVPNRSGAFTPPAHWPAATVLEKTTYDASTNPNFDALLAALGRRRFVVYGVATEYCVRAVSLALRKRGVEVDLVTDAIQAITEEGGRRALEEMVAAGVRLVTSADVCKERAARAA